MLCIKCTASVKHWYEVCCTVCKVYLYKLLLVLAGLVMVVHVLVGQVTVRRALQLSQGFICLKSFELQSLIHMLK